MLRALLLPLALLLTTASTGRDPAVRLYLDNNGQYLPGDRARVEVEAADDGYLLVLQVDPERRIRVLFPLDPTDDSYVRGGRLYTILGRGDREGFATDLGGDGVVFAAMSPDPWRFDRYALNGHWDVRTINGEPVADPESELVDFANRVSTGRFDYDILPYTVTGPSTYADQAVPEDVASSTTVILGGCLGCDMWGPAVTVGWGLYDPFFYDPWYWRAGYWGPVWNPWIAPVWWGPAWAPGWGAPGWGWGGGSGGTWGGGSWSGVPGWQYRAKSWDRQWAGRDVPYRDRWARGALATNTVVGSMPGTGVSQRVSFRDRLVDQPAIIRNQGVGSSDRTQGRRTTEGRYQGRAATSGSAPATRERTERAPARREASSPDTRSPGIQQQDGATRRSGGTARRQVTGATPRQETGTSPRQATGTAPREAERQNSGRREPVLERRGGREQAAPRPSGGQRQPEAKSQGTRSPGAQQQGSRSRGAPAVRSPSGSGRSAGPTPSAPRSGGQSSSRRR